MELETQDGSETEVRVSADGEASVVSTEAAGADDAAPGDTLDADTIRSIVDAALAEVDGRILEIEAGGDGPAPFEVTVVTGSGDRTEIELDASFAVVSAGSGG